MRKYLFADEAGDFDFSRKPNVSKYYICCAVCFESTDVGIDLMALRRQLMWDGVPIKDGYFHATKDSQTVRDAVFAVLVKHDFTVYAQIMEKAKAQPQVRVSRERFYKHGWFYLFKFSMPRIVARGNDELMVTTASIGTKKGQDTFSACVSDALSQTVQLLAQDWRMGFCAASTDLCLQAADYCTWAIQRKWEKNDDRSYKLIENKIKYEYDLWRKGTHLYY